MAASAMSAASTSSVRPDLKPGVATITIATAAPPSSLSRPVVTRPFAQRAEVPLEPAVLPHCGEVVDHAEEPEPEHREQHRQARRVRPASEPTPMAPSTDRPASITSTVRMM